MRLNSDIFVYLNYFKYLFILKNNKFHPYSEINL